ncbi:MAG: phospho-sugar mutase [Clostridia bacterium]|nr:phospho-sugar mutase [Clostridia bacterium]
MTTYDKASAEYERWLGYGDLSAELRRDLEKSKGDREEILLRFGGELSFGTAGLRGVMSAGTNRMNIFTVARATQGLADCLKASGKTDLSVVIARDTRINSDVFEKETAQVLSSNGIKVFVFDGPRPTPELSFAVRHLGCSAGINITASHNPKEYNGYKVYGPDGAQISPEVAGKVSAAISKRDVLTGALCTGKAKTTVLGGETDRAYLSAVLNEITDRESIKKHSGMPIVYTPLHGAGRVLVPQALAEAGFTNVVTVEEQMIPDGSFPTVRLPNPEFPEAFELGLKLARENGAELIIATDPDSDRMGVMIRRGDGYELLSGNRIGCLLLDYIINACKAAGGVPADAYAVKSIVSTELASDICRENGVRMFDVLTGFRFIGDVMTRHAEAGTGTFLLGFEESNGYLKGTYARDKDAVVASVIIAEAAAHYRSLGLTLGDALDGMLEKYGYYSEKVINLPFPGSDGKERMTSLMSSLRDKVPESIAGEPLTGFRDYLTGVIKDLRSGEETGTGLPTSNVIYLRSENCVLVVRPSGTEPKIKLYLMAKGANKADAEKRLGALMKDAEAMSGQGG